MILNLFKVVFIIGVVFFLFGLIISSTSVPGKLDDFDAVCSFLSEFTYITGLFLIALSSLVICVSVIIHYVKSRNNTE
jgi:hypothetical protein